MKRQFQGEDENVSNQNQRIFFKLKVADSIVYYLQDSPKKFHNILCEIEVSGNIELFDQVKEHERIRFYNLKGTPKHEKNFKYYDHETGKIYTQYLYLQFQRHSKYEIVSELKGLKKDMVAFKEFTKERFKPFYLPNPNSPLSPELVNFYEKNIRLYKNEIDIVGILIDSTPNRIYGCLSDGNYFKIAV